MHVCVCVWFGVVLMACQPVWLFKAKSILFNP